MSILVRPARVSHDEPVLAALNVFVQDLHRANRLRDFQVAHVDDVSAWFRSLLEQPGRALVRIAEEGSVPVGYVVALLHERAANPFRPARRWCEIDQLAVDERWRRRGVAQALLERILDEARACGIVDVEASSWAFNESAHRVLRRLGFAPEVIRFRLTGGESTRHERKPP